MVVVNRMRIPTVETVGCRLFLIVRNVGRMSDFYDFLVLTLCMSNLIEERS